MTLDELRNQWEKRIIPVCTLKLGGYPSVVLVVLRTNSDFDYRCHRYFECGENNWQVRVDLERVSAPHAFKWLEENHN